MPEITISMAAGRTDDQKAGMMRDITQALVKNLGVEADAVVIQINEAPLAHKMKGGKTFVERAAAAKKERGLSQVWSPRTRGPIATGVDWVRRRRPHRVTAASRGMGPCFRRDDDGFSDFPMDARDVIKVGMRGER